MSNTVPTQQISHTASPDLISHTASPDFLWPVLTAKDFCQAFKVDLEDADQFVKDFLNENPWQEPTEKERRLIALNGPGDSAGRPPVTSISIFLHMLKRGCMPTQFEFSTFYETILENSDWWSSLSEEQQNGVTAKAAHRFWPSHFGQVLLMIYLQKDLEKYNCQAYISSRLDVTNNNDVNVMHRGWNGQLTYGIGYRFVGHKTQMVEKKRGLKVGAGIWYNIDIPLRIKYILEEKQDLKKYRVAGGILLPAPWDIDHIRRDMIYDVIALSLGEPIRPLHERQQYYTARI